MLKHKKGKMAIVLGLPVMQLKQKKPVVSG